MSVRFNELTDGALGENQFANHVARFQLDYITKYLEFNDLIACANRAVNSSNTAVGECEMWMADRVVRFQLDSE